MPVTQGKDWLRWMNLFVREAANGTGSGIMQPGRDHYPGAMSVLVSGGGIRTGQVIGSTNAKGEHPKDRKLDPNDLLATIYRFLSIDHRKTVPDIRGRPTPLIPYGEPIRELLRVFYYSLPRRICG